MYNKAYDVLGIGFGPANIAVACAMEEMEFDKKVLFLEARQQSIWQEHMLLEDSDVQNHPLRDLVTPRNPRSKYSFTNFLFEHNRLFEHLNTGMHFPFRVEFTQYISWVASHFDHLVKYNTKAMHIKIVEDEEGETLYEVTDDKSNVYLSKALVVAPGRTPNIPFQFKHINSERVVFLTEYLKEIKKYTSRQLQNIAVVGGSQSAVELLLHLSDNYPEANLTSISRSFGFKQKDVNPFTGEVYFPEFVNLFHKSPENVKRRLIGDLYLTNYSASDMDVLEALYKKIYLQKITNKQKIFIKRSADIRDVEALDDKVKITYDHLESEGVQEGSFDLVILATGFKNTGARENEEAFHPIFSGIIENLEKDEYNLLKVNYNYSINIAGQPENSFFLNGLCESSHGMGDAGSFSLLSLRSAEIVNGLKQFFTQTQKTLKETYAKA